MQRQTARVTAGALLDPFNAFVFRGSLRRPLEERLGLLQDWKIAVKDNISVQNWPLTCASRAMADFTATYNADAVEALLAEGAEIVGKTNMDEFGMGSRCERSIFGPTLNPLDPSKSAGGSSGGCAAAVAANLARVGIGSDTGGSVRLPASYCGIVGFKPSWGVLSRYGLVSYAPSLDTVGILSRSVQDCIDVFEVIRRRQPGCDPTVVASLKEEARSTAEQLPLEGLLIGVPEGWLRKLPSDHPLSQVLDHLDNQNARLVLIKSEQLEDQQQQQQDILETYYKTASMEASSTLARYTGMFWNGRFVLNQQEAQSFSQHVARHQEDRFSAEVLRRVQEGRKYLSDPVVVDAAFRNRQRIKEAYALAFRDCDLIVGPTALDSAPTLQEDSAADQERPGDVFTVAANLADLPAISLPLHHHHCSEKEAKGVIGTQIIAPNRNDLFLLRAARSLEESFFSA